MLINPRTRLRFGPFTFASLSISAEAWQERAGTGS
jgi:hypothetical protein